MPDARHHRGPDPRDAGLFGPGQGAVLREAVSDLSWLLGRGYAEASCLKLVGDRYRLAERQRKAVMRSSCGDRARDDRRSRCVAPGAMGGRALRVDGFNVLTTVEAALGGAVVLLGRDGALRDIAGVHGTYRRVEETGPAIERVVATLDAIGVGPVLWLLDRPVSNSGRLAAMLRGAAAGAGQDWVVALPFNPDAELVADQGDAVVASADAAVLDRCGAWLSLARLVVERTVPGAWIVDLSGPPGAADAGPAVAAGPPGQ